MSNPSLRYTYAYAYPYVTFMRVTSKMSGEQVEYFWAIRRFRSNGRDISWKGCKFVAWITSIIRSPKPTQFFSIISFARWSRPMPVPNDWLISIYYVDELSCLSAPWVGANVILSPLSLLIPPRRLPSINFFSPECITLCTYILLVSPRKDVFSGAGGHTKK